MAVFAIGDLHLPFGDPRKDMGRFRRWSSYVERIEDHWRQEVRPSDLVLIPGDISWAMKLEQAEKDLAWIAKLPGEKILIQGNHDYWWPSAKKLRQILPQSIHCICQDAFTWKGLGFGGARLWDSTEYSFGSFIEIEGEIQEEENSPRQNSEAIFKRELGRLERSLAAIPSDVGRKIALTHYPPIGADMAPSRASAILERYGVDICVFGHLHNVTWGALPFGLARGVTYILTSADYLDFSLVGIIS